MQMFDNHMFKIENIVEKLTSDNPDDMLCPSHFCFTDYRVKD